MTWKRAGCVLAGVAMGCSGGHDLPEGALDLAVCDPAAPGHSSTIDNPYFPLVVGSLHVFTGMEAGALVTNEVRVLDATEIVAGIPTRVMEERESEDGALVEVSHNFFVEAADGTVCYFGEDVDIYEGGQVVDHEGQWRAGAGGARPGIMMPAHPAQGMVFAQEDAPGVAEDWARIEAVGETVTVPAGTFQDTLRTYEATPLESGTSSKVYALGPGMIRDDTLSLQAQ